MAALAQRPARHLGRCIWSLRHPIAAPDYRAACGVTAARRALQQVVPCPRQRPA